MLSAWISAPVALLALLDPQINFAPSIQLLGSRRGMLGFSWTCRNDLCVYFPTLCMPYFPISWGGLGVQCIGIYWYLWHIWNILECFFFNKETRTIRVSSIFLLADRNWYVSLLNSHRFKKYSYFQEQDICRHKYLYQSTAPGPGCHRYDRLRRIIFGWDILEY